MANENDKPVILSHETNPQIRINIDDPTKPKKPKFTNQIKAKESVATKLKHAFLGPDVDDVGNYILKEYLEPTGKRLLNNGAQGLLKHIGNGIQVLLFGKVVTQQNGGVDYTSFYNPGIGPNGQQQQNQKAYKIMDAVDTFTMTREDALETLAYLRGRIQQYGSASVLDYYEHINAPLDYMMSNRGWKNLDGVQVLPMPGNGFYIDLPRPIALKQGG